MSFEANLITKVYIDVFPRFCLNQRESATSFIKLSKLFINFTSYIINKSSQIKFLLKR